MASKRLRAWLGVGACVLAMLWGSAARVGAASAAPVLGYKLVHVYPHDPEAFTQGLEYRDGFLYEGTGLNGRSSVRKVEIATGKVLAKTDVMQEFFGEGITLVGQKMVELTWQSHEGLVYELPTLRLLRRFGYPGEGWGLTHDAKQIYMSDGTPEIRVWDPESFEERKRIRVHDGTNDVVDLNELEFVKGDIYANLWQTDRVAVISTQDGSVKAWIDLTGLLTPEEHQSADVLNGIAYDAEHDRLFFTGKLWPKLFELKIGPKSQASSQTNNQR